MEQKQNQTNPVTEIKRQQCHQELDALNSSIDDLRKLLAVLLDRLTPVMAIEHTRTGPCEEKCCAPERQLAPIAERTKTARVQVQQVSNDINIIINRLEC